MAWGGQCPAQEKNRGEENPKRRKNAPKSKIFDASMEQVYRLDSPALRFKQRTKDYRDFILDCQLLSRSRLSLSLLASTVFNYSYIVNLILAVTSLMFMHATVIYGVYDWYNTQNTSKEEVTTQ
jgi:hypothetical protein